MRDIASGAASDDCVGRQIPRYAGVTLVGVCKPGYRTVPRFLSPAMGLNVFGIVGMYEIRSQCGGGPCPR
jgi:hypothetical protein